MRRQTSRALYQRAERVLVGGVNSPVRAFMAVGGNPVFIRSAKGSKIEDEDGNCYIDYVCSWGALILGSAHPKVVGALRRYLTRGTSYGAPTKLETELAERVVEAIPSIEKIRFVNSGTEATMSAIRLARAYTKRSRIVKFEGCYHGHADYFLVSGGSGMATFAIPNSAGVPSGAASGTLTAPYNNSESVRRLFEQFGDDIAAVIVEPAAANMGLVPPKPNFLAELRRITNDYESILIFDEVVTGFRAAYGGAQTVYGVQPDLTCLGKIIGGGLPVGAYGGREDVMNLVAPLGPVYQAGTLSGNPMAMAAGIVTLNELRKRGTYDRLEKKAAALHKGFLESAEHEGCIVRINRVGSMLGLFFCENDVADYASAKLSDVNKYRVFFHAMLDRGVYLPPSAYETLFVSLAHTQAGIAKTVRAARRAFHDARAKAREAGQK